MTAVQTLNDIGELRIIERLCRRLPAGFRVLQGPGDDCAVVRIPGSPRDWLLKSDPVIEGVHFDRRCRPEAVGHKAVGRVLSDIAAMAGRPEWALIDLVAPPHTPVSKLEAVYRGAGGLARKHRMAIVGGDTARGRVLELHVFAVGSVPRGKAVLRRGARPGDAIFVTGRLGGSRQGRHLSFEPRVREGAWLGKWASAMIDLSDGLATDLRHLLRRSRAGARLHTARIPVSPAARGLKDGRSALHHALGDGEDFELLFTVPRRKTRAFLAAWRRTFRLPCALIGEITRQAGAVECVDADGKRSVLKSSGYQHFAVR